MNINFQEQIPADFSDSSRVWIYQASRPFTQDEIPELNEKLERFIDEWTSHGNGVKGFGKLFFQQFLIVMADEKDIKVGGCSTDSMLRFIKSLEEKFNVTLTDRLLLAFIINNKIELLQLEEVNLALEDTLINPETLYFNNTILTKKDLLNKWIISIKDSWLAGRIGTFFK